MAQALVKHAEREHAECGASGAARWTSCAGSNWMLRQYPQPTNAAALQGTRAHEMLEVRLRALPGEILKESLIAADPASIYNLSEMYDHLNETVQYVADVLDEYPDAQLFIESKFKLTAEIWGTNDIAIYLPSERRLVVLDLKYGMKIVKAEGNMQTRIYAMGVIEMLREQGLYVRSVYICISQPRCHDDGDGIRGEEVSLHDLFVFRDFLERSVEKVQGANAFLSSVTPPRLNLFWNSGEWKEYFEPSKDACYFCAKAECPAYEKAVMESIPDIESYEELPDWSPPDVETMDIERLEIIERNKEAIGDWLKAVTKRLMVYGIQGHQLHTLKIVKAEDRRTIIKDEERVIEELYKISNGCIDKSEFYRQSLKGIGDLEKTILSSEAAKAYGEKKKDQRKGIREAMAETIVQKGSSGKLSLVPIEDPRDPIARSVEIDIDYDLIAATFDDGED